MYKSSGQKHYYILTFIDLPDFHWKACAFTLPPIGHFSPSAIEMEEKEVFRRVNSVKSSGENKPFSS